MKFSILFLLLLLSTAAFSQRKTVSFSSIDWRVADIDASSPDALAMQLTAPYATDLEKVRAIFRWITEHIEYNTLRSQPYGIVYYDDGIESAHDNDSILQPLDLRVAEIVLKRRVAFCEGYARLFKTLCGYAGIRSEIISGYSPTNMGSGRQFRCNHKWNAVLIDSNWYLLDVTWASGYLNFAGDRFIRDYNDYYFLTPPGSFISDHYPEDIRWALLPDAPTLAEFKHSPFKQAAYSPYKISSYSPSKGIIDAYVGDTISIELQTHDATKHLCLLDVPSADSVTIALTDSVARANRLTVVKGDKVRCSYVVASEHVQWLQVIYNGDMVLRYKLDVKRSPLDFPPINIEPILGTN